MKNVYHIEHGLNKLFDGRFNPTYSTAKEKSPYLLQHAYNPVNWYPWGEEAFQKAIEEDKPIFLSIGLISWNNSCNIK